VQSRTEQLARNDFSNLPKAASLRSAATESFTGKRQAAEPDADQGQKEQIQIVVVEGRDSAVDLVAEEDGIDGGGVVAGEVLSKELSLAGLELLDFAVDRKRSGRCDVADDVRDHNAPARRPEAVKKLGQAPSRPLVFRGFRCFGSEPVPFLHSRPVWRCCHPCRSPSR
jgi:hypothetical protein